MLNLHWRWLLIAVAAMNSVALADERSEALDWARSAAIVSAGAIPIASQDDAADLRTLAQLSAKARVVAFGEATHGSHEFLAFRNRLFAHLVEHHRVSALAAETGFAETMAVDDYVLGRGPLTADLVAAVFSFGAPEAYRENYELIEWMRAHNAKASTVRKVHFYGLEMMGKLAPSGHPYARKAFDASLSYLTTVDAEEAARMSTRLSPLFTALATNGYESLSNAERDSLTLGVADLVRLYERRHIDWVARSGPSAYHRGLRNALNARNLDADLRGGGWWISRTGDRNQRDASSAESLRWVLEREGSQGRVFVFAHNVHVRKGAHPVQGKAFVSMGQHLSEVLGDDFFVIGSVHADPKADPGSVSGLLNEVGQPSFVLDLRQGQRYGLSAETSFDALWFVREIGPAQVWKPSSDR